MTENLPPGVEQLIINMFDENLSHHTRENYKNSVQNIQNLIGQALAKYEKARISNLKFTKNKPSKK